MSETWKTVVGFRGYEVSDHGNMRRKNGTAMKISKTFDGYPCCSLKNGNKWVKKTIHPLVLATFHSPRPIGHDCCHNDGIKTNNHISNLRWDTRYNNNMDTFKHGKVRLGEKHGCSKLTVKQVIAIRKKYAGGMTGYQLVKKYGMSKTAIYSILSRATWKHVPSTATMEEK